MGIMSGGLVCRTRRSNMKLNSVFTVVMSTFMSVVKSVSDTNNLCDQLVRDLYQAIVAVRKMRPKGLDCTSLATFTVALLYSAYTKLGARTFSTSSNAVAEYWDVTTCSVTPVSKAGYSSKNVPGLGTAGSYLRRIAVWCDNDLNTFLSVVETYLIQHNDDPADVFKHLRIKYTERHKDKGGKVKPADEPVKDNHGTVVFKPSLMKCFTAIDVLWNKSNAKKLAKDLNTIIAKYSATVK